MLGTDRTAIRYRRSGRTTHAVRARLRALAGERRRFGYRRLGLLLSREGVVLNHKKLRRLYAEERLQVRRRGGRKRALGTRAPMAVPDGPNQRWSLDFVSDSLSDGRRFRMLCVVDDCTRECLGLVADTSLSGLRVARELDAIVAVRGLPLDGGERQRDGADEHGDPVDGRRTAASAGTTSRRASRSRTPSSRASTVGCATNA